MEEWISKWMSPLQPNYPSEGTKLYDGGQGEVVRHFENNVDDVVILSGNFTRHFPITADGDHVFTCLRGAAYRDAVMSNDPIHVYLGSKNCSYYKSALGCDRRKIDRMLLEDNPNTVNPNPLLVPQNTTTTENVVVLPSKFEFEDENYFDYDRFLKDAEELHSKRHVEALAAAADAPAEGSPTSTQRLQQIYIGFARVMGLWFLVGR